MTNTIAIDGAWFTMGSDRGPDNERPPHRVWVDTFELAATQVTNDEFALFVRANGAAPPPFWNDPQFNSPQQPVVAVSWFEAVSYCDWLSAITKRAFRLPTEAEWERAARGARDGALYPWGDDPPESQPGYDKRWITGPERVAQRTPADSGLFDICENVHEWCSDWYAADAYAHSNDRNPHGPDSGARRVSRGGSWRHRVKISRCAARSSLPPESRYNDYGFRVACS